MARQQGFSVSEWRVMASLAGGEPISIGQLAQITVIQAADSDAAAGPHGVARTGASGLPHDSDRRITLVRITRKGLESGVEHLMELAREHERRVLGAASACSARKSSRRRCGR